MWCAAPAARRAAPAPRGCGMRRRWWRRRSSLASLEEREQAIGQRRQVAGTEREAQVAGAEPGSQVVGRVGEARHPRHGGVRSEEHTSELQSLMRISYAVFCLKKKNKQSKT